MEPIILDNIPFQLDMAALQKRLHIKEGSGHGEELERLAAQAQAVGKPKAMYKMAFIEDRGDDYIIVDGVKLTSRVLRVNVEQVHRLFPYVATCGAELDEWEKSLDDLLERYWADAIKAMALNAASRYLDRHMTDQYPLEKSARMNPGSLADWPLREQRPLFALLGNPQQAIGVQLTDSFLMIPNKSVSGIRFPTESSFENCQLCPRESCPGRRARYDKDLYEKKYKPAGSG